MNDADRKQKLVDNQQRMFDLVRQMRMELHSADLITNEEYAELAIEHSAVARLESYDQVRAKIADLQSQLAAANEAKERAELKARKDDEASHKLCCELAQKLSNTNADLEASRQRFEINDDILNGIYAAMPKCADETVPLIENVKQLVKNWSASLAREQALRDALIKLQQAHEDCYCDDIDDPSIDSRTTCLHCVINEALALAPDAAKEENTDAKV